MAPTTRGSVTSTHVSFQPKSHLLKTPVVTTQHNPQAPTPDSNPLRGSKVVSSASRLLNRTRRSKVTFSPTNATKLFHSHEPPLPLGTSRDARATPSSDSTDVSVAVSSPSLRRSISDPDVSIRGILKPHAHDIPVAPSVKEGTWNNREPARLRVTGSHPRSISRSSPLLSQLCDGEEGDTMLSAALHLSDDDPGSDDTNPPVGGPSSGGVPQPDHHTRSDGSEEEEEVECMHPESLVEVILNGADDLLTLEEAYTTLTLRIRECLFVMGPAPRAVQLEVDNLIQPITDEAPALVCAIQRDLGRLMGKVPSSEVDAASSPFRALRPAAGGTTPPPKFLLSPESTPKKGYTETEVRYRREAAGVGCAAMRFLACILNSALLYSSFTEANLQALIEQVLAIPRTPKLPTPAPKRTYTMAMIILSQIRLPSSWVKPICDKIVGGIDKSMSFAASNGIKDPSPIRKEALNAIANLVNQYPDLFFASYSQILPTALQYLANPVIPLRKCASAVASAYLDAKMRLLASADSDVTADFSNAPLWNDTRAMISKSETDVASFLKSPLKVGDKFVYDNYEQRKTEWTAIESTFRQTIGSAEEVSWACSTWAAIVGLMGGAYSSSPLTQSIVHIIDRSLQPTTNTVRPTLASAAWQHAIYAYLVSDLATSLDQEGDIVRTYTPFEDAQQDSLPNLRTISFPISIALQQANSTGNYTLSHAARAEFNGDTRCSWTRAEKPKRLAWMVTSGLLAPAVIYAYTLLALLDRVPSTARDAQSAGPPSSDINSIDVPVDGRRLANLDVVFERVVSPLLLDFFKINGVDRLKILGWDILEAITSQNVSPQQPRLERLLSQHYLSAEYVNVDRVTPDIQKQFENDRIEPEEIPPWGDYWVAKRLARLLSLFQEGFNGIRGINELRAVEWVTQGDNLIILPQVLSRVWANLLGALKITYSPDGTPTLLTSHALNFITNQLVNIFERDPATYVPICLLGPEEKLTVNADAVRLGITWHLYHVASEILGEGILGMDTTLSAQGVQSEAFGNPSMTGILLRHVLDAKLQTNPDAKVVELFQLLVGDLLKTGSTRELGTRMLGDVANRMPWLFEDNEEIQLEVWRLLSLRFTEVTDVEPVHTTPKTNYTGVVLVSLLSNPFRSRHPMSLWYNGPKTQYLETWKALLQVTVLRFRAKRAGSNFGVIEALAAHIDDFVRVDDQAENSEQNNNRLGCATTLSCLAAAIASISFVPTEHYHASHFGINDNYVPVDFLALAAKSLLVVCPIESVLAAEGIADRQPVAEALRGPLLELIKSLAVLFTSLAAAQVQAVLEPLRQVMAKWFSATIDLVGDDLHGELDNLYVAVMSAVARAVEAGAIPASSDTVNGLIDLYAPRLSCGSEKVPAAFVEFWRRSFHYVPNLEYSDDVAGFLHGVAEALPDGVIQFAGLTSEESCTESSTRAPVNERALEGDALDSNTNQHNGVLPTATHQDELTADATGYEADVSLEQPPRRTRSEVLIPQSPSVISDIQVPQTAPEVSSVGKRKTRRSKAATDAERAAKARAVREAKSRDTKKETPHSRRQSPVNRRQSPVESSHERTTDIQDSPSLERLANHTVISETDIEGSTSPVQPQPTTNRTTPTTEPLAPKSGPPVEGEHIRQTNKARSNRRRQRESRQSTVEHDIFSSSQSDAESARSSIFSSASRWLRRVPSIGALFHPATQRHTDSAEDLDEEQEQDDVEHDAEERNSVERHIYSDSHGNIAELQSGIIEGPGSDQDQPPSSPTATEISLDSEAAHPPSRTRRRRARKSEEAVEAVHSAVKGANKDKVVEATATQADQEVAITRSAARRRREEEESSSSRPNKRRRRGVRDNEDDNEQRRSDQRQIAEPAPEPSSKHEQAKTGRGGRRARKRKSVENEVTPSTTPELVTEQAITCASKDTATERVMEAVTPAVIVEEASPEHDADDDIKPPAESGESGVFDDAPGDETPATSLRTHRNRLHPAEAAIDGQRPENPTSGTRTPPREKQPEMFPTPIRRSRTQTRLLSALEDAAGQEDAIATLDFDGVMGLLANLDRIRSLATGALAGHAEEGRRERRLRRARGSGL